jgi:signal transduction histidine kinase
LLQEAVQEVKPFAEQRQQRLALALEANLGAINIEPDKIRDSLENLLFNAIKFTPDAGTIQVIARHTAEGSVEISVRDSGVGIEAGHQPHLFKSFFTGFDVSRHCSGQFEFGRRGLGLGLSLVKAFVEMHGGQVRVASEAGKGATFVLTFPRSP